MLLLSSADIFKIKVFKKKYFRNTIRVSNGLDSVDPDLGPKLFAKVISRRQNAVEERVMG